MNDIIISRINMKETVSFALQTMKNMKKNHEKGLSYRIYPDYLEFRGGKIILDKSKIIEGVYNEDDLLSFANCMFYLISGKTLIFADLLDPVRIQEEPGIPVRFRRLLLKIISKRMSSDLVIRELHAIRKEISKSTCIACFRLNEQRNQHHKGNMPETKDESKQKKKIGLKLKLKPLWSFSAGSRIISSPVVYKGSVFCASSNKKLFIIDKHTGEMLSELNLNSSVESTPAIYDNKLYLGDDEGNLYLIDVITGQIRITKNLDNSLIRSSPLITDDGVFIGTYNGNLFALSRDELEIKWSRKDQGWIYSSCACIKGKKYIIAVWDKGKIGVYKSRDGTAVWEDTVNDTIRSTPVVYDNRIYLSSFQGFLYIFDTAGFNLLKKLDIKGKLFSTPVLKENLIILASMQREIKCIDVSAKISKQVRWVVDTKSPVVSSPVIFGDFVIASDEGGIMYIMDLSSGSIISRYSLESFCRATPTIDGGILYTASAGKIEAFKL